MATDTKSAKNSLKKQMENIPAEKNNVKTIFDVIKSGEKSFAAALPKHMNSERFVRIALTQIRQNPKLLNCTQESLLGCLMTAAQLGLEPGVLGQVYLIPFNKKNKEGAILTVECQLQISYKGMIELLRRTGQLKDIYAYQVYTNDEFNIEYGLDRTMTHKPAFDNPDGRGETVGFYSVAILKDGTKAFDYMTKKEVLDHEAKYRLGKYKNDIWNKNFDEMAMKTVTKKMLKWLPLSAEMLENLRKEDSIHKIKNIEKFDEIEEENIFSGTYENVSDAELLATKEEREEILSNANMISYDIVKVAKEQGIDFENLTKTDAATLQSIIDDETIKRMGQ